MVLSSLHLENLGVFPSDKGWVYPSSASLGNCSCLILSASARFSFSLTFIVPSIPTGFCLALKPINVQQTWGLEHGDRNA